jgi:hypothetical protein
VETATEALKIPIKQVFGILCDEELNMSDGVEAHRQQFEKVIGNHLSLSVSGYKTTDNNIIFGLNYDLRP